MPVFIRNFSLSHIVKEGQLDSEILMDLYKNSAWRHAHGAMYMVNEGKNNLQFIFRAIKEGEDIRILGTDTHYRGKCIWNALPFFNMTDKEADVLSATIAITNNDQSAVCVTHLMNAAVLPELEQGATIEMQVVGFPLLIESYESREDFEKTYTSEDESSPWPLLMGDQKILPLNFMLAHDPDISEEKRAQQENTDVILLASVVLDVERKEGLKDGTYFNVATVMCEFGHLELIYSDEMVTSEVKKGSYIVCSAILHADVALGEYENWVE
ncbi:MAG: hypothetical protein EOM67_06390 [Spirochaetia bacterium]|nr:hypothetical protein [Spirochaetia bacterium]